MARRRARGGDCARRDGAGGRRGARRCDRAAAGHPRTRSRPGRNGLLAGEVHRTHSHDETDPLGRAAFDAQRELLGQVSERYGVPAPIIVAIWGMESNFGRFSGVRPTVPALATLAWDPRRATFFRGELFDALEILNRGDIDLSRMKRIVGRRDGPDPVHAVKLPEIRRGLRRRRQARHLVDAGRRVGVDCQLSEGTRLGSRPELGARGQGDTGGGAPHRPRRRAAHRQLPGDAQHDRPAAAEPLAGAGRPAAERQGTAQERHAGLAGVGRRRATSSSIRNYDAILEYNCAHSYAITVALLGDAIASDKVPPASKPKKAAAPKKKHAA